MITIGDKIARQLIRRGWTESMIRGLVNDPAIVEATRDMRHGSDGRRADEPATAYIDEYGGYVVVNDLTGDVVQVSDREKPGWKRPF